jgi:hypothetical protein
MIQFNLLPDVKLEYIKARQTKRLVILVSAVVTSVSLAIVVVLFLGVNVVQKNHLNNLQKDIDKDSKAIQEVQDLNKILSVQSQLNNLNGLHDAKPAVERLGGYLGQVVPNEVSISDMDIDYTTGTMVIDGSSDAVKNVNEFVDTLKFTTFTIDGQQSKAFPEVVLTEVDRNDETTPPVTYKLTIKFDPMIFNITKEIKLEVPNQVTTRSVTERPSPLFQAQPSQEGEENDGN